MNVDKRIAWLTLPVAFAGGVLAMFLWQKPKSAAIVPEPLVLEKVQALGELHTARYTYRRVFEAETSRPVADWAKVIPGAASLVKSTTTNTALVSTTAEVEAGVDLGQARQEGGWIVLPHAKVYQPTLEGEVHQQKAGILWRDVNIGMSAASQAKQQARQAAVRQGILTRAEAEAVTRVKALVTQVASSVQVRVEGQPAPSAASPGSSSP